MSIVILYCWLRRLPTIENNHKNVFKPRFSLPKFNTDFKYAKKNSGCPELVFEILDFEYNLLDKFLKENGENQASYEKIHFLKNDKTFGWDFFQDIQLKHFQ